MHLDRLLETLAKDLKLEAIPQKDKLGVHQLKLLPEAQVGVSELDPGVYLSALMMPLPKDGNKESLFIYLMQANLVGQGVGGGAIGIDPSEKFLTLSLTLPFEVNYTIFKEHLEDFVNYISFWREEVMRFQETIL